ncbi:MAG: GrpB family protein [Candidatus Zixiibacteriota bacterium]|nr:MAG: GrpB family protein [candidate division Zixibacteria bacterium]
MSEEIEIVPYAEDWPSLFEKEKVILQQVIGSAIAGIEHVGSTAIPNMPAKPVIDILIESEAFPPSELIITSLAGVGYTHKGDCGVPGRHFFKKGSPRSHHIHFTAVDGEVAQRLTRFRDILRGDSSLASEYGELKQELARQFKNDRDAYALNKANFVNRVLGMNDS